MLSEKIVKNICYMLLPIIFLCGKIGNGYAQGTQTFHGEITNIVTNGNSVSVSNSTAIISVMVFPPVMGMSYPPMASATISVEGDTYSINGSGSGGLPVLRQSYSGFYASNEYIEPISWAVQRIGVNYSQKTFYIESGGITYFGKLRS